MRNIIVAPSDPGGYDAHYTSLNAAETGEDGSLADDVTITCAAMTDTAMVTWAGWTQGSFTITVQAASGAGFDGVFTTTGRYLLDTANTNGVGMVTHSNTTALTVTYKNIQFRRRGGSSFNFRLGFQCSSGINTVEMDGCYVEVNGASQALPTNASCVNWADNASRIFKARNSVFRCPSTASNGVVQIENGAAGYLNNCVVDGAGGAGIGLNRVTSGTLTAKNTVVFNCTDDVSGTVTLDYCATDDNDGTNAVDLGDNSTSWNTCFTDYANLDYTIKDSSAPIYNTGTDLSADANYAVTTDIIGTARPQGSVFDIGISELVAGGGGVTGASAPSIPAMALAAAGAVLVAGAVALSIPAFTEVAAAAVRVTGSASNTIPAFSASSAGTVLVKGAASQTIPAFDISASSQQMADGDAALTIPAFTITPAGTVRVSGTASLALPIFDVASAGGVRIGGAASISLAPFTIIPAGAVRVSGASSLSIPAFTASGASAGAPHADRRHAWAAAGDRRTATAAAGTARFTAAPSPKKVSP